MGNESFSLVRAVPGMRPGSSVRNLLLVVVAPALVLVWPFVVAYAVGTNRGGSAVALSAVPGISPGGGSLAAVAAFTWTSLALAALLAPVATVSLPFVSMWLTLALPALYLLVIGYGGARSVALFRAWWGIRASSRNDLSALDPGEVQVSGAAQPAGEAVETPFSETASVAHVSGRYQDTGDADPGTLDSSTWALTDRYTEAVPFVVGEDGGVLVDATPDALSLERSRKSILGDESSTATEPLPDGVADQTVSTPGDERAGPMGFVEQRIEPGETVTVSGIAVPPAELDGVDTDHELVITDADSAPDRLVGNPALPLVVTDDGSNAGATDLLGRALALLVLTVLLTVPLVASPLPGRLLAFLGL